MKKIIRGLGLIAAATLTMGNNWNTEVQVTDRAHVIGNPEAEVTLTEFVSYTCSHCATFAIQGEAPLQMIYVGPGKVKLEVRSIIRNVVDLTATLLVQCGDTSKFRQNHTMFMTQQAAWLPKATSSSRAQQALWLGTNKLAGRQAMSQSLGFYDMMTSRGYSRPEVDRCLADNARADQLSANTAADFDEFGIRGTPSFAINGTTVDAVHGWAALYPVLNAQF